MFGSGTESLMTTFERRQRILALLREKPGLRVAELAPLLDVSEGTIRNDLTALEEAGHLTRVRGGATLTTEHRSAGTAFAARARANEASKQRIARWAAELVDDGDSILLDASTTVYTMARYLQDRRNLRVVTNGVEVGLRLAQNPSNSVILLGGSLHVDSASVTGPLSEAVLKDLHIKTAFVSCSGLTVERGLAEEDLSEAQLKSRMVACADAVVALVDASKFGREDLTFFARVEQIARIYTDSSLDPAWIEQLQNTGTLLTCVTKTRSRRTAPAPAGTTASASPTSASRSGSAWMCVAGWSGPPRTPATSTSSSATTSSTAGWPCRSPTA
jgi:DeoR/GlpR family transcriptional regulator of sugar metabolism